MKLFICLMLLLYMNPILIYNFSTKSNSRDWRIIDDGVMGGKSQGNFSIDEKGNGVFEGAVSLENNGGFSSVRYQFDKVQVTPASRICLFVKGDKKEYQFRIKDNANSYYSYITTFKTSGEWEEIEIPLKDLYPSFRGRTLDLPNFSSKSFEEIVFLIGNKKNENFKLILDKIELK
ncbi:CIA30 family protein [Flavobacterium sp.]|uniref:CIA30 family protein n=1 Tax=Flavobacterium sp. TaxID=239 RepID=UPI00248A8097|nr:CIA30 family protein [Flavobacterium sp.]MDI1317886.1 CIA30 family protein [Flavobacterium sp.]